MHIYNIYIWIYEFYEYSIYKVLYIYMYIYKEMVDFGKSSKMIKILGKVDKSNTSGLFVIFHSLFNEENITTKPIESV